MDEQGWEYCRIARVMRRLHWWSRRRDGVFAAMVSGHPIARSATFPIPSPTDADIAAFHALLAQLQEDGWEAWRGPRVHIGPRVFAVGYWDRTLRRRSATRGLEEPASSDEATREIDLPPPPIDALPPDVLPPGKPVPRRRPPKARPSSTQRHARF